MDDLVAKLRILARAELTLARIHGRRLAAQGIALATVVLLGLVTVAMLNLAAFTALADRYGATNAALLMALGDALLAAGIAVWASRSTASTEEALVVEIQDMVLAQLQADLDGVGRDITQIRDSLTGSGGLIGLASLAPLVGMVVSAIREKRADDGDADTGSAPAGASASGSVEE